MKNKESKRTITPELIKRYAAYLWEEEKSVSTVKKYIHDLNALCAHLNGAELTKTLTIGWKDILKENYAPASVNAMLAAMNSLFDFCNWHDLKVKALKIQKSMFCDEGKELTREEYFRLVRTAEKEGNERLSLLIQTICATGIRVSELKFITAEAVHAGKADVSNKGKRRTILLPKKLCRLLQKYLYKQKRDAGVVFITKTGKPIDRSNIWRNMKALCANADVEPGKVFPHNLRHNYSLIWMSCGENRMTFGFSGVFYPQNARKKEAQFRSCHFGDFKAVWDLNPHRKHRYRQKRSTLNPMKQPKLKKKTQVAPFLKWLRMPDSKKWRPFYIKPRKPLLQA